MKEYFITKVSEISKALNSLDEAMFFRLISDCDTAFNSNSKIIVSGLGNNVPICEKFVGMMNSLSMNSRFMNTNSAMHGDLGMIEKNDVLLILSKSGNTLESISLYEYIKNLNVSIWLLSFNDGGVLGKLIEKKIILTLPDEGDIWNILPNNSSSVYLILLQGLAMQLAIKREISKNFFFKNHPGGNIGKIARGE